MIQTSYNTVEHYHAVICTMIHHSDRQEYTPVRRIISMSKHTRCWEDWWQHSHRKHTHLDPDLLHFFCSTPLTSPVLSDFWWRDTWTIADWASWNVREERIPKSYCMFLDLYYNLRLSSPRRNFCIYTCYISLEKSSYLKRTSSLDMTLRQTRLNT